MYHYAYDSEIKAMIRLKWEVYEMTLREALEKIYSDAIVKEIVKIRRSWFQDDLLLLSESEEIEGTKKEVQELLKLKDTFNKLGYKTKINTHITSCINLFLDIYLYSEYRLIYC